MTTVYTYDGYTLSLQALGRMDRHGHEKVLYRFCDPHGDEIFSGDDFGASPLHDSEGEESAKALLGFLTLQEGDTDSDYFDNYTEKQIAFRDSIECEHLQIYSCDE